MERTTSKWEKLTLEPYQSFLDNDGRDIRVRQLRFIILYSLNMDLMQVELRHLQDNFWEFRNLRTLSDRGTWVRKLISVANFLSDSLTPLPTSMYLNLAKSKGPIKSAP